MGLLARNVNVYMAVFMWDGRGSEDNKFGRMDIDCEWLGCVMDYEASVALLRGRM